MNSNHNDDSQLENIRLRVSGIVRGTSVDGPGLRTSIYFSGCNHRCPGCHNPSTWDFNSGQEMNIGELLAVIEEEGFNVTFSGGDPFYQAEGIAILAEEISRLGYRIWCYTGFTFEELQKSDLPGVSRMLAAIDTLVDGPYIESLRDPDLLFRGSSNQRIIQLKGGKPVRIGVQTDNPLLK